MQHEPGTEHIHTDEQDHPDAKVFGNVSTDEVFRNGILENKRRLLDEMNAMPEVNDDDITKLKKCTQSSWPKSRGSKEQSSFEGR